MRNLPMWASAATPFACPSAASISMISSPTSNRLSTPWSKSYPFLCARLRGHIFYCGTKQHPLPSVTGGRGYRLSKKKICIHFHQRTCADDENTSRAKNRVRVAFRHENAIFCVGVNPKEGCRSVAQPHRDEPLLCVASNQTISTFSMTTGVRGLSFQSVATAAISSTTSMPDTTWPNAA